MVSLADFGGAGDGETLNTEAIAKAIAALAEKRRRRTGRATRALADRADQTLHAIINLHLERGALIKFSGDYKLYPLDGD